MSNTEIIKTYVWHDEKCFFVSTIERDSSAMEGPSRYNETMVWPVEWPSLTRGELIYQDEFRHGSIHRHQQIVEALHDFGNVPVSMRAFIEDSLEAQP